jgi:cell division initiation protein
MITAKEIHRKKFEKVKFGYSPDDVDAFMTQLEADVRLMEQELADSGEKISLLADKVREYKETEDDMRNALIGAQKQARQVIEAANEKAAQIEAEARAQVGEVQERKIAEQEAQLKSLTDQIAQQTALLDATKKQVAAFRQSLFDMYRAQIAQIAKLPDEIVMPAAAPAETAEEKPAETAEEKPAETAEEKPAEPAEDKPAETAEEKPAETVEEKPAESAEEKPAEIPAEPAPAEETPAEEKAEEKPAVTGTETVTEDPFAGSSRRRSSPESRFGGRGDKKKRS